MPIPGLSLLGLKRIGGFVSILRYINPTIIIIIMWVWGHWKQNYMTYYFALRVTQAVSAYFDRLLYNVSVSFVTLICCIL